MNRIAVIFALAATGAQAHPGHIVEVAGHNHWLGAAAIAAAVGVALWQKWKDRAGAANDAAPQDPDEAVDDTPQEA